MKSREAVPSPYPVASCDPAGFPWELPENRVRVLLAHLQAAPEFTPHADEFAWLVNTRLRLYREHRDDGPWADPKRLGAFAAQAAAFADAIEAIDSGHGLFNAKHTIEDRARVKLPAPWDLHTIAEAARGLQKQAEARSGKGKRHEIERVHRYFLICDLWSHYPEPLRSVELRSHFLETLRIILQREPDTRARRTLQAEARRALAGIK